jgi:hypothetical protein
MAAHLQTPGNPSQRHRRAGAQFSHQGHLAAIPLRRGRNGTGSDFEFTAFDDATGSVGFHFQNDAPRRGGDPEFLPPGNSGRLSPFFESTIRLESLSLAVVCMEFPWRGHGVFASSSANLAKPFQSAKA